METNSADTSNDPRFYPVIESGNYISPSKLIGLSSGPLSLIIGNQSGGLTSSAPPLDTGLPIIDCIPATGVSGYDFIEPSSGVLQYQEGLNYTQPKVFRNFSK